MTVLLVFHILLAIALVGVILLQRTAQDGGGLTSGSGGGMGGLFTARGSANVLTRTTAILATLFLLTSLGLALLASRGHQRSSVVSQAVATADAVQAKTDAAPQASQSTDSQKNSNDNPAAPAPEPAVPVGTP